MEQLVEVKDLCARYDDRIILDRVTMAVQEREIMVILGTSGCGKTTLLKNMIRLQEPYSGEVRLFGRDVTHLEEDELAQTLRQVGVMFQYGALINSLTVAENIALPLQMHMRLSPGLIRQIVRMKLHMVELDHAFSLYPSELSGGMRKRAALARALALDPRMLFCDEPGAGLDPVTALGIDRLLLKLNADLHMTIAVVTHELESIRRISHRLTMLHEGRVLYAGTLQEATRCEVPEVREFFLQR